INPEPAAAWVERDLREAEHGIEQMDERGHLPRVGVLEHVGKGEAAMPRHTVLYLDHPVDLRRAPVRLDARTARHVKAEHVDLVVVLTSPHRQQPAAFGREITPADVDEHGVGIEVTPVPAPDAEPLPAVL